MDTGSLKPDDLTMSKRFTVDVEASSFGMVWVIVDERREHERHESVFFDKQAAHRICRKLNALDQQINLTFS